ncbi:MAG TPA: MFS transporter [Xanthobacteraceae bacterium]|nr:MFS transporter [Xanthobacteraceae bacterium]
MTTPSNVFLLYVARGVRGFGDGFAIIILPAYLTAIGYDPIQVGVVATASLFGTALFTLAMGVIAPRYDLRTLMLMGAGLMALTGLTFPNVEHVALIAVVAFVGTINPATGDLGYKDDHALNAAEWIVYDALYAYCKEMVRQGKTDGMFV